MHYNPYRDVSSNNLDKFDAVSPNLEYLYVYLNVVIIYYSHEKFST